MIDYLLDYSTRHYIVNPKHYIHQGYLVNEANMPLMGFNKIYTFLYSWVLNNLVVCILAIMFLHNYVLALDFEGETFNLQRVSPNYFNNLGLLFLFDVLTVIFVGLLAGSLGSDKLLE